MIARMVYKLKVTSTPASINSAEVVSSILVTRVCVLSVFRSGKLKNVSR